LGFSSFWIDEELSMVVEYHATVARFNPTLAKIFGRNRP
tara:strand:+ start:1487 stop:1603 length:117 start_codon:yes stop_codon:yes gene_type:complete